jgi:formylglycine-generating enzyme required for sulfatase activity
MLKILSKRSTSIFILSAAACLLLFSCENPFMQKILDFKTVSFNTNGGSSVPAQNLIKGWKITRPDDPVKPDSDFDGWYIDNDTFLYEWDFDDVPAADMTLHAKWIHSGGNPREMIITAAAVTVTGPAKGEPPDTTASGTGNFTIGTVTWSPDDNPFQGGIVYTVSITITAHDGYTFAEELTTAMINGQPASVTNNNGNTLTLSYTFAQTDTRTVTGIEIKAQPNNLTYNHGDALDLSGLVVTLAFDTDETEGVALDSFASRNISTEPLNGTPLVHIAHNGIVVKVEYGHHLANTESLTVNPRVITFTVDPIPAQTYTGSAIEPTVRVWDGATLLVLDTDYTVTYANNINEGTAAVAITGAGNYAGSSGSTTFFISVVTYTVTFNADGGTPVNNSISVIEGGKVTKPANPTKAYTLVAGLYRNPLPEEWQFNGWYNGDDEWDFNDIVTGDMTLTAQWINPEAVIDLSGQTGANDVEKAIAYLNGLTTMTGPHTLLVGGTSPVSIGTQTINAANFDLTIQGLGTGERTIQLSGAAPLFTISASGVKLTLGENITLRGIDNGSASLVRVTSGTLVMEEGSKIIGHTNNSTGSNIGGAVNIGTGGTLTMTGGQISDNSANNGAGVYISGGTFTMTGGKISGNNTSKTDSSNGKGGGVYISGGTFAMTDGEISDNISGNDGGGVYIAGGTFTMTGGQIRGNTATPTANGGGVYFENGYFTVGGTAKIRNNNGDKGANDAHLFSSSGNSRSITLGTGNNAPKTGTDGMEIYVSLNELNPHNGTIVQNGADAEIAKCFHADKKNGKKDKGVGYIDTGGKGQVIIFDIVEMVQVGSGDFWMGQNGDGSSNNVGPVHKVTLTGFSIGKFEITQAQYEAVMAGNDNQINATHSNRLLRDEYPVEQVSWFDALVFCNRLSILEGYNPAYSIEGSTDPSAWGNVPTDDDHPNYDPWNKVVMLPDSDGYRLPTEAQWEYAAKGGLSSEGYIYSGSDDVDEVAWYNSTDGTHEVGEKISNELGLYDMSGNVWEWCWDWYGLYTDDDQTNPEGASSGLSNDRVIRGGGWKYNAGNDARSVHRGDTVNPYQREDDVGFRVVRAQ